MATRYLMKQPFLLSSNFKWLERDGWFSAQRRSYIDLYNRDLISWHLTEIVMFGPDAPHN